MAGSLARLLKLRHLLEESSRMELERRAALALRVDHARERQRANVRESRERALGSIFGAGAIDERARQRTVEWGSAEEAGLREQQLHPLARAAERSVSEGRGDFLERRKERLQVERVLEAEMERLREERERRTQRELDDWFGMKQARERRNES